jgi:hypothetical protein
LESSFRHRGLFDPSLARARFQGSDKAHNKRLAIIRAVNRPGRQSWKRGVIVTSRDGSAEWARLPDSNLVLFPGAFAEEETYELPESTEEIDALALDLNRHGGAQ